MLRGTGAAVKPTSQCFTFFTGGEKKTWQKKGKCEVFSHSLIEQAVLAGIKWINVKSDSLTKPHERHKPTRGLENSSVGIMNRVQLEILLAVQLGALHARSYWALQYWAEGKLSTLSLMSKTWVVWGAIMWGGGKSCSPSNLRMRDLTRSQDVCLPSSCSAVWQESLRKKYFKQQTCTMIYSLHILVDLTWQTDYPHFFSAYTNVQC